MGTMLTAGQTFKSKTFWSLLILVAGPQIWQLIVTDKASLHIPDQWMHWGALVGGVTGILFRIWNTQGSEPSGTGS